MTAAWKETMCERLAEKKTEKKTRQNTHHSREHKTCIYDGQSVNDSEGHTPVVKQFYLRSSWKD